MVKRYIFNKKFEDIFTKERIYFEINRLDTDNDKKENLYKDLERGNFFDFSPHTSFLIPKDQNEFRKISVPSEKTKIIQRILSDELSSVLKFSDRSYAYQKGKSPQKAVNRVKHIIKNYNFVIKTDIDSFFDKIDHSILLKKLEKIIEDKKIIYFIVLFLKNGSLFKGKWEDKLEGVYQGDVLSPLLSNIYLHSFDRYFELKEIEFVRFADDLIFFAKNYEEAKNILHKIKKHLSLLKLSINENKTYIAHKNKTFEYLGVRFDEANKIYSIDNERLMDKISKISQETKKLSLKEAIEKINEHVEGFSNYYLKIINNQKQFNLLLEKEKEILISKVYEAKLQKTINRKEEFIRLLFLTKTYYPVDKDSFVKEIVEAAYEKVKMQTPKKSAKKDIEKKKNRFFKNYLKAREIIITKTGSYLYFNRNKIKIRSKDEPVKEIPYKRVDRIIITNKSTSISNYLIYICSKHKIDIDFIDQNEPYALLTFYKNISKELHIKQLKLSFSPNAIKFAANIHLAKAKNQINLLKYFNLRRKDEKIKEIVKKMESFLPKIKKAKESKNLMGIEGQISNLYWNGFKTIGKIENFQRKHKEAKDPINQALNYGYAILYNRIQSALIKEGLNIYYSFLHATDHSKPTLTFDFIEPFRQPIVDREILSILTKKQTLKTKDGLLDKESKKLVIQNIQERLSTQTKTKYGKTTFYNLIQFEANAFKRAIEKGEIHKFFVAKY